MVCTSIQNKTFDEIIAILERPEVEMAEIRLDLCPLDNGEIEELFSSSDTPLVATCRAEGCPDAEHRLSLAIKAGARFADLEIEAPASVSKRFQKLCRSCGTEIIRSYHDFEGTPDEHMLQMALARCFRYGADIAKIVTTAHNHEDADRVLGLYSVVLEGVDSLEGKLIAFSMGDPGRESRLECLRRGAPFTYAALSKEEATAPGQWTAKEMYKSLYGDRKAYHAEGLRVPASKSFAQRAILAAALAEGTSRLGAYSPCADSESAISLARQLGAEVSIEDGTLVIKGTGPFNKPLSINKLNTGESGLLTRLAIPVSAAICKGPVLIEGRGTLLDRPLKGAGAIMASYGVLLRSAAQERRPDSKELFIPLTVNGRLVPGNADINGKDGSQLVSGLMMALPLCDKDSYMFVSEPKSIPYMYITLDVLRHFGISTRSEMEGDESLVEGQDWSGCTGITFKIKGGQRYKAASFDIEGDWSAAANFLVAGSIFGSAEVLGLDPKSLQADLEIIDILVNAGAVVSQVEDGSVCVRKAPLEAFEVDLNHAPDLFPIVSVLAAFCSGVSRIAGVGRLATKESNRAEAIVQMLQAMGVDVSIEGDILAIAGEALSSRILRGHLLHGGQFTSRHDHRMVMALKVAQLGADSPVIIDDEDCVSKSFPGFKL